MGWTRKKEKEKKRSFTWCLGSALCENVLIPEHVDIMTLSILIHSANTDSHLLCAGSCAGCWEFKNE